LRISRIAGTLFAALSLVFLLATEVSAQLDTIWQFSHPWPWYRPWILPDGGGGAFITYFTYRAPTGVDSTGVTRVDSTGAVIWNQVFTPPVWQWQDITFLKNMLDYSRYILFWRLCSGMSAEDVKATINDAIAWSGVDHVYIRHRPRLLSDNGPCYISGELKQYLADQGFTHTRCKPFHPMTQGKIERYHRSMKNILLLDNYYCPEELTVQIEAFVEYYNNQRYHESLDNVTPADVYYGRATHILDQRQQIKKETIQKRREIYRKAIAIRQSMS
jgi:putative transposase